MKTKDRIIETSRLLFNEEGERNVTMVDVADAMNISPGNLYYHYRGKDQVIPILLELFEAELGQILNAPLDNLDSLEDYWAYFYLILETLYNYRFVYGLDFHYDQGIAKRYKRLISLMRKAVSTIAIQMLQQDMMRLDDLDIPLIVENITLTLLHWLSYAKLVQGNLEQKDDEPYPLIHRGILQVMAQLSPYMNDQQNFLSSCKEYHDIALASVDQSQP